MRRLFICVLAWGLACSLAWGSRIEVSDNVSGVWDVDTVLVVGEIIIPASDSLLVEPGVKVIFQNYYQLAVYGRLRSIGTLSDSVIFQPTDSITGWKGIHFFQSLPAEFNFTAFYYGRAPGTWGNGGGAINTDHTNLDINHCLFVGNNGGPQNYGGAVYSEDANITCQNSLFFNNVTVGQWGEGGAIYFVSSDILLENCVFLKNFAGGSDGALTIQHGTAIINDCIFLNNYSCWVGGGAGILNYCIAQVSNSIFSGNSPCALDLFACTCDISKCIFIDSYAVSGQNSSGHAWIVDQVDLTATECLFMNNHSLSYGGAIDCSAYPNMTLTRSLFIRNNAVYGGGIAGGKITQNCTLCENSASSGQGAGIRAWFTPEDTLINNCIAYSPAGSGLYLSGWAKRAAYNHFYMNSDGNFSGQSWPGLGQISRVNANGDSCDSYFNIFLEPMFVDPDMDDYRLHWDSPLIDAGDPAILDPDGTPSDMGAFYYDQRYPVHVLLTPHQVPYLIPAEGGSLDYTLRLSNHDPNPHTATLWCDITLPDSSIIGPVLGPVQVTAPALTMLARVRTQTISADGPLGVYHYNAYAVVGTDTSKDSFMFGKLGDSGQAGMTTGWANTGEDFAVERTTGQNLLPASFCLLPSIPNPFNSTAAISYQLSAISHVSLKVYDAAGRLVATLVNTMESTGVHTVHFDGSGLPSGIYFVRLQAGEYTAVQKLVLLK